MHIVSKMQKALEVIDWITISDCLTKTWRRKGEKTEIWRSADDGRSLGLHQLDWNPNCRERIITVPGLKYGIALFLAPNFYCF